MEIKICSNLCLNIRIPANKAEIVHVFLARLRRDWFSSMYTHRYVARKNILYYTIFIYLISFEFPNPLHAFITIGWNSYVARLTRLPYFISIRSFITIHTMSRLFNCSTTLVNGFSTISINYYSTSNVIKSCNETSSLFTYLMQNRSTTSTSSTQITIGQ